MTRRLVLLVLLALLGACRRTPESVPVPPDWHPVPLAHLRVPEGTPCAEGLDWLYGANCTGQAAQPICLRFVELVGLFEMPESGLHCDPKAREEAQSLALRWTQRSVQRATPEQQADPSIRNRVDDQRLWLLDGFIQSIVERGTPRPGQAAEARAFAERYRPTDFSQPLGR